MLTARYIVRCLHTSIFAQTRHRPFDDPGVKRRMKIFDEDDKYKEEIEEDEDISGLESDFHNVDFMYKEHKREIFKKRQFDGNKITAKKFFAGPKPPNMLTWAERLQIKKLHEKDPEEWSLDALSESFPATRSTISKILNTKWEPDNIKKMKQKDQVVNENWQLLAENKLEADPELLDHFKKFLPRREEFLESIQNDEMIQLFEKPEPKKVWNNGQMSKILESYDNSLRIMDEKQRVKQELIESKDNREILAERINYEVSKMGEAESFKLDSVSRQSKPITLSELKKNLKSNEKENLLEQVMVEKEDTQVNSIHINERLANLAGYSLQGKVTTKIHHKKESFDALESEDLIIETQKVETFEKSPKKLSSPKDDKKTNHSRFSQLAGYNIQNSSDKEMKKTNSKDLKNVDEITRSEINKIENQNAKTKEQIDEIKIEPTSNFSSIVDEKIQNENILEDKNRNKEELEEVTNQAVNFGDTFGLMMAESKKDTDRHAINTPSQSEDIQVTKTYDFPSEQDRAEFETEEKSISKTFFWNNNNENNKNEIVQEANISNLDVIKLKQDSVIYEVEYAERIKIPKEKRGSGLTFRVKDCYYDDDGQFLYRVPGMTKTEEN